MSQEGIDKIKSRLQELTALVKDQAITETQELKEDILHNINELKSSLETRLRETENKSKEKIDHKKNEIIKELSHTQDKLEDNLQELLSDLESKALKVQYTIQEKYSRGVAQKDEIVVKAADSLIEAINKVKTTLHSEEK